MPVNKHNATSANASRRLKDRKLDFFDFMKGVLLGAGVDGRLRINPASDGTPKPLLLKGNWICRTWFF